VSLIKHYQNSQKRAILIIGLVIFFISLVVSSSHRGTIDDGALTIDGAEGARIVSAHQLSLVFSNEENIENKLVTKLPTHELVKIPARLTYLLSIAIGYKIFGISLLALHLFPYVLQILNPCVFFIIAYRFSKSMWWGLAGALFFIFHPFNLMWLNIPYNSPIFMFFLLMLILLLESSLKNPKLLIIFGVATVLLMLTRFGEGVMFVLLLYAAYIMQRWSTGIPVRWILLSIGALLVMYSMFAFYFGFPLEYPIYYLPTLLQRQAEYGADLSFYQSTIRAFRVFVYWYFCGKFMTPFLLMLTLIGAFVQVRKRIFYPIVIFLPHVLFLLFVANVRYDLAGLKGQPYSVPGFILLLLSGIQIVSKYYSMLLVRVRQSKLLGVKRPTRFSGVQKSVSVIIIVVILGFFFRSAYSLAITVEDVLPATTMWRIVKYNPLLPGDPLYKQTYIQLSPEERIPALLREEVYKAVQGNYRSWYLPKIGEYAFEHGLPEKARTHADFFYFDEYSSKNKWEADRYHFEGTSPLWNDEFPGRIGAFPSGKSGSFVYKFDFPNSIDYITISDIHTQWGIGDVTKMWTSTDGEHWRIRYNNWNVRYTEDHYYQFFEDEFDGQRSLFVKYYFFAGDKTRASNDNRGASLEEFSLAVKYRE
jgi:hypothetical protein